MSACTGTTTCTCGCCAGVSVLTPQGENNPAGLSAIAYRTGIWSTFKRSMLARLSSSDYPALAGLRTRADDDFSIALVDASAVMLDILTFYQERLANESYLRTATQLYSLTQLSQLIGYQPSPGVSASAYVAFTLTAAPGSPPDTTNQAITIPAGSAVQSVPAQGQTPQTFETSADILGKPDWNALPVQTGLAWTPGDSPTSVWLSGIATSLQPGDAFLIVGDTGDPDPATWPWLLGAVSTVQLDRVNQRTLVSWGAPLASLGSLSGGTAAFLALRQRAALFGYSAINPQMLAKRTQTALGGLVAGSPLDWTFAGQSSGLVTDALLDLDAVYSKIVSPGWAVVMTPGASPAAPTVMVSPIQSVITTTRSGYGASAKITRTQLAQPTSGATLADFYPATRTASVLAQSEALAAAEQPLDHPLYGTLVDLEGVRDDLAAITAIAVIGKSQKVTVAAGLTFQPYDSPDPEPLNAGDTLTLLQPPNLFSATGEIPGWTGSTASLTLVVADANGRPGTVVAALGDFALAPSSKSDPVVQEIGLVSSISLTGPAGAKRTRITLQAPLLNCYDRVATSVNANVGVVTGGRSVTELLGDGAASTPNQAFALKQSPLTYTQAQTPTGRKSSLTVRVNSAAWTPVPCLYAQPPTAQVYATVGQIGGTAVVQFGDGVEGAVLPTGQGNVMAEYRVGLGQAGNVGAGAISTLLDRPLGVSGVTNPMAATGGQDPQSADDIRANAPQGVLTLGRAVSITDYQTFAGAFAGIAKAYALWIPNGANRGVFVTVAAAGGAALPPGDLTLANLVASLTAYGNPQIRVQAQSFYETLFGLEADIAYDPAYDAKATRAAVLALLTSTYGFAARSFGQGVSSDEIAALIQGVTGVTAVNVKKLSLGLTSAAGDLGGAGYSVAAYNAWIAQALTHPLPRPKPSGRLEMAICPYVPTARIGQLPPPADLLVLDPDPAAVVLGTMS